MVDKELCIGCGTCVGVCQVGAIELKDGVAVIDNEKCIKCHACEDACPVKAIKIED